MSTLKNSNWKFLSLSFAVLIAFGLLSGCSKSSNSNPTAPSNPTSPEPNQVWMQNSSFVPASISVSAGTKVTWINKDSYAHTVTSGTPGNPTGLFDSGNINAGGTFSYTFDSTGTYQYYCRIHPDIMQGTVTVK